MIRPDTSRYVDTSLDRPMDKPVRLYWHFLLSFVIQYPISIPNNETHTLVSLVQISWLQLLSKEASCLYRS